MSVHHKRRPALPGRWAVIERSARVARERITNRRNRTYYVNPLVAATYGSILVVGVIKGLSAQGEVDMMGVRQYGKEAAMVVVRS